jgi:sugar phosphate isomerase/epimerase
MEKVSEHELKLLCSTAPFFQRPVREAFNAIAGAGFTGVEVLVCRDPQSQNARSLADLADEFGLSIHAIHAPTMLLTYRTWGTWIDKLERSIDLAAQAGVGIVVAHPPFRWQRAYDAWLDAHLSSPAKTQGVTVAIENMCPFGGGFAVNLHRAMTPPQLERFPNVTLDTSHAAASRVNPLRFLEYFGDRIRHIHLSNNSGKGWDSHSSLDEGVLNMRAIVAGMLRSDYSGGVSLELDLRRVIGNPTAVHNFLVHNRVVFENLRSGD